MKKLTMLILALLLVVSLVACSSDSQPTDSQKEVTYNDGEYTAQGPMGQNGYEDAIVVIKDGKIAEVTLRRLDAEGNEVDYERFVGKEIEGKLYPNLKEYRFTMADEMVEKLKQGNKTYDVLTMQAVQGNLVDIEMFADAMKKYYKDTGRKSPTTSIKNNCY